MSIDGVTAGVLLSAVQNGCSHDEVYKLYKDLQGNKDAPAPEVIEFVESMIGKTCKIKYTSHIGKIHSANRSDQGFYPGGRYPAYIEIISQYFSEEYKLFILYFGGLLLAKKDQILLRLNDVINNKLVEQKTEKND